MASKPPWRSSCHLLALLGLDDRIATVFDDQQLLAISRKLDPVGVVEDAFDSRFSRS